MILLAVIVLLLALALGLAFLLGFRLGGQTWLDELTRVKQEAAEAERQLYRLTQQAFVAMATEAERQVNDRHHPGSGRS